jgi:hypothetical protein
MGKLNSIWDWDLWHEMNGTKNTIVLDSNIRREIERRLKKKKDNTSEKNNDSDEKTENV